MKIHVTHPMISNDKEECPLVFENLFNTNDPAQVIVGS